MEWESAGERDCLYKVEAHLREDTPTLLQVRIKQQKLRLDYFTVVLYVIKSLNIIRYVVCKILRVTIVFVSKGYYFIKTTIMFPHCCHLLNYTQ